VNLPTATFLNDPAEYHAAGIGALVGVMVGLGYVAPAFGVVATVVGVKAKRADHLGDAKREFGYLAGATVAVAALVTAVQYFA